MSKVSGRIPESQAVKLIRKMMIEDGEYQTDDDIAQLNRLKQIQSIKDLIHFMRTTGYDISSAFDVVVESLTGVSAPGIYGDWSS